jgi:preprotein translocase SecE subunit
MQYLKDTRAELRHVAWPTQTQTIVYTLLVAGISLGVAAYLGLFDFLFTTGLAQMVNNLPSVTPSVQTIPVSQTQTTPTPATSNTAPVTLPFTTQAAPAPAKSTTK